MKTAFGMAKINLRQTRAVYYTALIALLVGCVQYTIDMAFNPPGNVSVAVGNYLFVLPALMVILVASRNFTKLMNLGGKRMDFFKSCIITYLPVAVLVSLVSIISHLTIDKLMLARGHFAGILDLYEVFGFMGNGAVIAFFQMTAFLLLLSTVAHTLTLIQGRWYGWVADAVIAAIISVFTPIAPLRAALIWFFNMIIFHNIAIVQIASCLVLGAAVYIAGLVPIKSKRI